MDAVRYEEIVRALPPEREEEGIRENIVLLQKTSNRKIVVLDDDPTGVQTVHGIDVWTVWDRESLREAFQAEEPLFYILTNTRSLTAAEAERVNREIAETLCEVAEESGMDFTVISRSDSTLRGHYPLEIDVLREVLARRRGIAFDGHVIVPAFFEGHRYTTGDVHYLRTGESLVPVHLTEFARDVVFGYSNSDLRKWVEEKTKGRIKAESCLSVATETLRCGVEAVCRVLRQARGFAPVIANTMSYRDMDVLSLALWTVECEGMRFLYRTSASFVKSFAGIPDQEPLPPERMIARGAGTAGGLVVVGSYVRKSSEQLQQLREHFDVQAVKLDVEQILAEAETPASIISQHAETISRWLAAGRHVVLFTSRKLALAGNRDEQLLAGRKVSAALSGIVSRLETAPRFLIAKGGITSSDVATLGLGIRRARVLGQAYPGVPVWRTGGESRFPDMPYIVFPGNVGEPSTLLELVRSLTEMPA